MELDRSKILAEKLLQIEGLGYDDKLRIYIEEIRKFRAEIEAKNITPIIERATNIDADNPLRILAKGDCEIQGLPPNIIALTTERQFDPEDKIGEY